jgi:hypothetical protein
MKTMPINVSVENVVQAKTEIERLEAQGYPREHIHIFAHNKNLSSNINESLDTNDVGMREQGLMGSMINLFSERGEVLRNKMEATGLTSDEAVAAERDLDRGKLVIVAHKKM